MDILNELSQDDKLELLAVAQSSSIEKAAELLQRKSLGLTKRHAMANMLVLCSQNKVKYKRRIFTALNWFLFVNWAQAALCLGICLVALCEGNSIIAIGFGLVALLQAPPVRFYLLNKIGFRIPNVFRVVLLVTIIVVSVSLQEKWDKRGNNNVQQDKVQLQQP